LHRLATVHPLKTDKLRYTQTHRAIDMPKSTLCIFYTWSLKWWKKFFVSKKCQT